MNAQGWEKIIVAAYYDKKQLSLLATLLEQVDESKQILSDKGYSWTGLSLLETVKQLPDAISTQTQ